MRVHERDLPHDDRRGAYNSGGDRGEEREGGVKSVFNSNYNWLFRNSEDRIPIDAEPHRKTEQQWAERIGKGKFPCNSYCQVCLSKPDGLEEESTRDPAHESEIFKNLVN